MLAVNRGEPQSQPLPIIENSEALIGRMYRKFLATNQAEIRLACIESESLTYSIDKLARPNDPLYLMTGTTTPAPYDEQPMFDPYPTADSYETRRPIRHDGKTHYVYVRCSMAKKSAREGGTAGSREYGGHAARNIGVSVLRAGRELELDPAWAMSDPRERWWSVEVEFPLSALDPASASNPEPVPPKWRLARGAATGIAVASGLSYEKTYPAICWVSF